MILPRLIIADEYRLGKVPSGVLIAHALKERGYKLRIFVGGVDETSLRSLQLLCGTPVTMLDPTLCGGRENLRWLFQQAASPECLNLILTNLGGRLSDDSPFRISEECMLLAEWLDCELIPVIYGDSSSKVTVRSILEILSQFERAENARIHSALFRAVLNNREYELLDREIGNQISLSSLGCVPGELERDAPKIAELCSENYGRALLPLRSAGVQLKSNNGQIEWGLFSALAHAAPKWPQQSALARPILETMNIAMIRHPALSLGGNGTELLLQTLGCGIVDVTPDGGIDNAAPVHGVYIPHGLACVDLPRFFTNLFVREAAARAGNGQFFFFAEGGGSPLLGETITLPEGDGEDVRGFGLLPFSSRYESETPWPPIKVVGFGKRENPLITGSQECVWGYMPPNLVITADDPESADWEVREGMDAKPTRRDGWSKGRALVTAMRPELWSCPELLRRWLED